MAEQSEIQKLKDKIANKKKKRNDLNKAIHEDREKLRKAQQAARNARLMQWGIALEQALSDPESELNEKTLVKLCRKYLSDRSLAKALTGPLQKYAQAEGKSDSQNRSQNAQQQDDEQDRQQSQQQDSKPEPPNRSE